MPTPKHLTKNFSISEFACHDAAHTPVPKKYEPNVLKLATELQKLRDIIDSPIHINSGYRTPQYNATLEGSAVQSQHLLALAADITTINYSPKQLAALVERLIKEGKINFTGIGIYNGFVHLDCRVGRKARWDRTTK